MAQQNLDFGTAAANDGETLFDGFTKVQANFTELYGFVNPLSAAKGGTGVANNAASTITISGNFATTLTVSNTTGVTLPVSGTLATLAGTEELTGKTLTSSVGKGTWTASGTWTLPAITLGGTVSGGGQQLNNIIIGTSTPLAITGTTITANTGFMPDADDGAYLGQSGTGFADLFLASGGVLNWAAGDATITHATGTLQISSATSLGWSTDLTLFRDTADTLAQRRGTNAQSQWIYNTWANAGTDFEATLLRWTGNQFQLITHAGGTGTVRQLALGLQGAQLTFTNGSTAALTSHLVFVADDTYDIGAHVATRPKNCWLSGALARAAPVTETNSTHTLAATTTHLICNRAGDVTVTLPTASSFTGREIYIKTIQAQTVTSNASNVVPSTSATAGTAICPATDGAWAFLVSDGTSWVIMAANPLV